MTLSNIIKCFLQTFKNLFLLKEQIGFLLRGKLLMNSFPLKFLDSIFYCLLK